MDKQRNGKGIRHGLRRDVVMCRSDPTGREHIVKAVADFVDGGDDDLGNIGNDARLAQGDLRLYADGNWYGKQYFDAFNTERDAQGAYGVANARVSFESTGRRGYAIGVWIKNITDRQYLAYALNQKDADTGALGFDYALVGEPRTYGADLTYRF
jgi:outer membrane receptor protein involved in Fe transport